MNMNSNRIEDDEMLISKQIYYLTDAIGVAGVIELLNVTTGNAAMSADVDLGSMKRILENYAATGYRQVEVSPSHRNEYPTATTRGTSREMPPSDPAAFDAWIVALFLRKVNTSYQHPEWLYARERAPRHIPPTDPVAFDAWITFFFTRRVRPTGPAITTPYTVKWPIRVGDNHGRHVVPSARAAMVLSSLTGLRQGTAEHIRNKSSYYEAEDVVAGSKPRCGGDRRKGSGRTGRTPGLDISSAQPSSCCYLCSSRFTGLHFWHFEEGKENHRAGSFSWAISLFWYKGAAYICDDELAALAMKDAIRIRPALIPLNKPLLSQMAWCCRERKVVGEEWSSPFTFAGTQTRNGATHISRDDEDTYDRAEEVDDGHSNVRILWIDEEYKSLGLGSIHKALLIVRKLIRKDSDAWSAKRRKLAEVFRTRHCRANMIVPFELTWSFGPHETLAEIVLIENTGRVESWLDGWAVVDLSLSEKVALGNDRRILPPNQSD
ncbi:hypothetical protein IW262DRAFT_1302211 [Armillaria fumosa]|nr:hypothetical protein IW262DRAFT_1302211 [Armillaria fumosa]